MTSDTVPQANKIFEASGTSNTLENINGHFWSKANHSILWHFGCTAFLDSITSRDMSPEIDLKMGWCWWRIRPVVPTQEEEAPFYNPLFHFKARPPLPRSACLTLLPFCRKKGLNYV